MIQLALAVFGVAVVYGAWVALVVFGEPVLLQSFVIPAPGVEFQEWLQEFLKSQIYSLELSAGLALAWHLVAACNSGRYSDRRVWWVVMWIFSGAASVGFWVWLQPDTQQGLFWAYALAVLNGLGPFWLGTGMWTPGASKYAPLAAARMRGMVGL